jgi:hypothetical protein
MTINNNIVHAYKMMMAARSLQITQEIQPFGIELLSLAMGNLRVTINLAQSCNE